MKSRLALKNIHLKKTNEYLRGLQQNLEEAGGLTTLWSERVARMTSTELAALGDKLGITPEGEYMPLASIAHVTQAVQKVLHTEQPKPIKDKIYGVTAEVIGFEQQVESVWFDYAYSMIEDKGFDAVPPTPDEIKTGFVNGSYDSTLIERYSQLRDAETNLLLSCHNMEAELSFPFNEMGPMK